MGMAVRVDVSRFKEQLKAKAAKMHDATRPAAQAGSQVIYERALINVPVSKAPHKFHGTHAVYGPYNPGNLRDAIYQVYSKSASHRDYSVYHISWNKSEAPYGFMVELGTSTAPARSFIARSVIETRAEVRQAMKDRFIQEVNK